MISQQTLRRMICFIFLLATVLTGRAQSTKRNVLLLVADDLIAILEVTVTHASSHPTLTNWLHGVCGSRGLTASFLSAVQVVVPS